MDDALFDALLEEYLLESRERLAALQDSLLAARQVHGEERAALLTAARRELHTLKGNSGMMGLGDLQQLAHRLEDAVGELEAGGGDLQEVLAGVDRFRRDLGRIRSGGREDERADEAAPAPPWGGEGGVRVPFSALDALVDQLSEMVIFRNRLSEAWEAALARLGRRERSHPAWREAEGAWETLLATLDDLQQGVMQLRMVPLASLFSPLRRIVFDESTRLGRQVRLEVTGGETPLDKALLEVASDVLGHLVRNAVVHGIEPPEERLRSGKPEEGLVRIAASALAEEVVVEVADDGRGIDRESLVAAAERAGHQLAAEVELEDLLALPGVTTLQAADTSAGRGMGTATVLEAVHRRGGEMEVVTAEGRGTRFRIRLPLSASIVRALLVSVDDEEYVLPLAAVLETVLFEASRHRRVNHAGVFRWRDQVVPLLDLGVAFGTAGRPRREGYVVVIGSEGRSRGVVVDDIRGVRDVVVKSLDAIAGDPPGVAGCTILGDGRVIMILDPQQLAALSPLEKTA